VLFRSEAGGGLGAAPGAYVALVVRDNGVGMDAETRSHIFEPFFTTKAAGAGTGLGLATVFGIVQQSGGVIRVESEPEEGAAFEILLPRYTVKAAESARARGVAGAPARGTETVLLVEDDDQVRRLASSVLRGHGYQVLEAADAAQALLRSERHDGPIHLLLTDVVMPKSSGRQLAERLVIERPEIRVLFMSGHTDDAVLRHGVEASALAFIGKPLTPDRLLAKVREVLDGLRGE